MRKLIVCNMMTLDGYYEGPAKDVRAVFDYRHNYPHDDWFDAYTAERLRDSGTLLLGRDTFLAFKNFWPRMRNNRRATALAREVAQLNHSIEKVVVSDYLTEADIPPWRNTRIVRRDELHQQVAALKSGSGRPILMFGSRLLWNDLMANGMVDELHLMISPVILGDGTPIFNGQPPVNLWLAETHSWDGSALVLARYEVRHNGNGH